MNQYLNNCAELAREVYIKCLHLALNDDFSNPKLPELNNDVRKTAKRYKNKPKKLLRLFLYTACLIYNGEHIHNGNICYQLNVLINIIKKRIYKPHKFIQFMTEGAYIRCFVNGMKYNIINKTTNKLLYNVEVE